MSNTFNKGYISRIIREDESSKNKITAVDINFLKGTLPKKGDVLITYLTRTLGRKSKVPFVNPWFTKGTSFVKGKGVDSRPDNSLGGDPRDNPREKLLAKLKRVPVILEVFEILNENIIRAIVTAPREEFIELIEDLPLGLPVINSGLAANDPLARSILSEGDQAEAFVDALCAVEEEGKVFLAALSAAKTKAEVQKAVRVQRLVGCLVCCLFVWLVGSQSQ